MTAMMSHGITRGAYSRSGSIRCGSGEPGGDRRRDGGACRSVERTPPEGSHAMSDRPTIVLVHGAWADGSCWSGVIERLQAGGLTVRAPQFPLSSLEADVARLRQVLEAVEGPVVVVGHSYGG